MYGLDIVSVVFPDVELKLFITASKEVRVERRFKELTAKGIEVTRGEVEKSITERDYIDSTRKDSPLVKTHDAVEIDNSGLTRSGQLSVALDIARNRINRNTNDSPGSDTLDQTGL